MKTHRFVPMAKSLCTLGCGHMARGGSHGSRKIELQKNLRDKPEELKQVLENHGVNDSWRVSSARWTPGTTTITVPNCPLPQGRRGGRSAHRRHGITVMQAVPSADSLPTRGRVVAGVSKSAIRRKKAKT